MNTSQLFTRLACFVLENETRRFGYREVMMVFDVIYIMQNGRKVLILDVTLYEGPAKVVERACALQDACNRQAIKKFFQNRRKTKNKTTNE